MRIGQLAAIGILISSSSFAAGPSAREAKQCVIASDADLVAELGIKISRPCSEYLRLDDTNVVDVSRAENTADVIVKLRYTVIKEIGSNALRRCIGVAVPGENHRIPVGTEFGPMDRKIAMQQWTSGWKCKN